tara:strand:- start:48 stop:224 length:177 start_codon:yes stop_codon:yes gene_type:complete
MNGSLLNKKRKEGVNNYNLCLIGCMKGTIKLMDHVNVGWKRRYDLIFSTITGNVFILK